MSGTPPTIEWYIAREGVQHGPVSDAEMRKFVELGHLRSTDLVWCQHFATWQTGGQVFPQTLAGSAPGQPLAASAPLAKPAPAPVTAAQSPMPQFAPAPSPAAAASRAHLRPQTQPQARAQPVAAPARAPGQPVADDAAWAEAMRDIVGPTSRAKAPAAAAAFSQEAVGAPQSAGSRRHTAQSRASSPSLGSAAAPISPSPAPFALPPSAVGEPLSSLHVDSGRDAFGHEPDEPPYEPPRRGWIGVATAAFAVILIVCGLGWFAWQNRTLVSGAGASAIGTVMSTARPNMPTSDHFRSPPYSAPGETREQIDAALQRIAVWRFLKREFADWYGEIVGEIERRRTQKQDERAITQFMVDVIVTLRRRNAQAALQASPDHLRGMASAFVVNLRQLGSRDGASCFAFVSHGESSPFMVELSKTPAFAETLQKQMISVFEAVVDARAGRKVHPNTRRTDYDRLTADLLARGWTQGDLATFSDPQKLSMTPPDKVCALVQEWFTTQLALKEPDLQVRLLSESLKPLVGG